VLHHVSYTVAPRSSVRVRCGGIGPDGFGPRGMIPGSVKEVTENQKTAEAKARQQKYEYTGGTCDGSHRMSLHV